MFIMINDRRVNICSIFEYEPQENKKRKSYSVRIKYVNGTEEDMPFFDNVKERDDFIEMLDKNLVK